MTFIPKRRWAKPTLPIDPQPLFIVPIRKEEPCLFPENLLDEPPPEMGDRLWWVVYTKSRQEKALSRELFKYAIPFYLPQIKNTTLVRGRHRTTFMPLLRRLRLHAGQRGGARSRADDQPRFADAPGR